jgi:hypothetical protein
VYCGYLISVVRAGHCPQWSGGHYGLPDRRTKGAVSDSTRCNVPESREGGG